MNQREHSALTREFREKHFEERFTDLCRAYHTPKVDLPWNPLSHTYAPHYAKLLSGRRIERVLEIGIGTNGLFHSNYRAGDSLRVWAEMFRDAEIFGIDNNPESLIVGESRIHTFFCDQSDIESIAKFSAILEQLQVFHFDLIVDDGSHKAKDQALTALTIGEFLSPTGLYVIEDVVELPELLERLAGEVKFHVIECERAAIMGDDRLLYFLAEENQ